ncbi:MAG: hypothetical protein QXV82_09350 [Ignisphaera sp.]
MAELQELQEYRLIYSASPSSITIDAETGYAHRIEEIWIDNPANKSYMQVIVGTNCVAQLPLKWQDCLFVAPFTGSINNISICGLVRDIFGADTYIEGDEDENIVLNFSSAPSHVNILYRRIPKGIDKTKLMRSRSVSLPLFNIVTHSADIKGSGLYDLDVPIVPVGFPAIANRYVISSGRQLTLKALAFGSTAVGTTTKSYPTLLHFWDETFELFTPITHQGISVNPSSNILVCNILVNDIFKVPDYVIPYGHTLTLNFNAYHDGTNNITATTLALIIIGLWSRVA